jgi:hypothetical protein
MLKVSAVFACLFLVSAHTLAATDCSVKLSGRPAASGSSICLETNNYPTDANILTAADRWNNKCDGGEAIPSLNFGGCNASGINIAVVYAGGVSTNVNRTCGQFQANTSGALTGGTITIYQYGQYLSGPEAGTLYLCSPQASDTLAHEIGHVLGLDDVLGSACAGHIMGQRLVGDRTIASDDCSEVNRLWNTPAEQQETCNRRCWTTCEAGVCPPEPVSTTPHPTMCPILIDLDNDGFHLAGLNDAVTFDLDADGQSDRISWTAFGTGDAFLVFDRNNNGVIDNGRELFGNATLLASGVTAPNGYEALIEFDDAALGGNGDSIISSSDAVWDLLQVWTDRDHDGISDTGELNNLDSAGIFEFDTRYKRSNKSDEHGNLFRFKSKAMIRNEKGRIRPAVTYDVFFVE